MAWLYYCGWSLLFGGAEAIGHSFGARALCQRQLHSAPGYASSRCLLHCRNYYPRLRKLIEHFIARVGLEALSKEELVELKRQSEFRTLKIGTTVWSERSDSTRFESAKWRVSLVSPLHGWKIPQCVEKNCFLCSWTEAGPTSCFAPYPQLIIWTSKYLILMELKTLKTVCFRGDWTPKSHRRLWRLIPHFQPDTLVTPLKNESMSLENWCFGRCTGNFPFKTHTSSIHVCFYYLHLQ